MNDTELIEGCKAGKREALETIYRLFSRQMYGVCYRYVGEDSALDVMHDGFVKVFSAIGQLHATDLHGFRSWITRIMVTTSLHHLRKQKNSSFLVSIRPRACFSPSYNKVKSQTKHVWLLTLL